MRKLLVFGVALLAACGPRPINVLEGDDLGPVDRHHLALEVTRVSDDGPAGFTLGGLVTDAELGGVLRGANILVADAQRGTATDTTGHFTLDSLRAGQTLRISFTGYEVLSRSVDEFVPAHR